MGHDPVVACVFASIDTGIKDIDDIIRFRADGPCRLYDIRSFESGNDQFCGISEEGTAEQANIRPCGLPRGHGHASTARRAQEHAGMAKAGCFPQGVDEPRDSSRKNP